ncbi:MAG: flagellar filament capping protein FliD [Firmicutes bacterium]|nr:flagellar filament capping protein FliD [Bacillota bacterium]
MGRMQIMGLASGIDVNSAIDALLEFERLPLTRMATRKDTYRAQQDAWRDINTRLSALDNILSDLRLSATFQGRKAQVSNEDAVSATANTQAAVGTYEVVVHQKALAHRIASTGSVEGEFEHDAVLTIQVGEDAAVDITIDAGASLRDIAKAINDSDASVKATIIGERLVLESSETGLGSQITLDGDSDLLDFLGLTEGGEAIQHAQDAEFSINGIELTSHTNTINDAVEGVTFTLLEGGSSQVTVSLDTDSAMSKIKSFVDQYNSVMNFIGEKIKVTMTDTGEIRSTGTLQGDGTANRLRDSLRYQTTSALSGDLELDYDQLAVLGITTNREGILQIDEAKLRAALESDTEEVSEFFKAKATGMKDFIHSYVQYGTGILAEKQDSIGRLIKDVDRQIQRVEDRVERREEQLLRQFTALEKALSGLHAQGDWLTQQLDMLSGWGAPQKNRV